jgi:nucleotide-binding universal stress UspA family protein
MDHARPSHDLASLCSVLRSVLAVVDLASINRVVERIARLPLARDATLTIVESRRHVTDPRALLAIHSLPLLPVCERIRVASTGALDRTALRELVHDCRADLVVVGDAGLWGWRMWGQLGNVPVLLARESSGHAYRRPLVAVDPRGGGREVLRFAERLLPSAELPIRCALGPFGAETSTACDLVIVGSRPRSSVARAVLGNRSCDVLAVPVAAPPKPVLPRAFAEAR